ncbi:hypothetical protein Csa_010820 [Cucumis sativus]|nr:hypothetical protein Csa_010820 [Cucumis sativus]
MSKNLREKLSDTLQRRSESFSKVSMKVMRGLVREFKRMQMKDSESIIEYSDKLIGIANKARALGTDLSDSRLVQKILVSVPERYEATIAF